MRHRLIAHPKDRVATLQDVQALPFFSPLPFGTLRQRDAPFVPVLDGETDVGYFDSFESPEDMAKYAEVFKKQRDVEAVEEKGQGKRDNWVGFTFGRNAVSGLGSPTRCFSRIARSRRALLPGKAAVTARSSRMRPRRPR
jgi:hypothetical protein